MIGGHSLLLWRYEETVYRLNDIDFPFTSMFVAMSTRVLDAI